IRVAKLGAVRDIALRVVKESEPKVDCRPAGQAASDGRLELIPHVSCVRRRIGARRLQITQHPVVVAGVPTALRHARARIRSFLARGVDTGVVHEATIPWRYNSAHANLLKPSL